MIRMNRWAGPCVLCPSATRSVSDDGCPVATTERRRRCDEPTAVCPRPGRTPPAWRTASTGGPTPGRHPTHRRRPDRPPPGRSDHDSTSLDSTLASRERRAGTRHRLDGSVRRGRSGGLDPGPVCGASAHRRGPRQRGRAVWAPSPQWLAVAVVGGTLGTATSGPSPRVVARTVAAADVVGARRSTSVHGEPADLWPRTAPGDADRRQPSLPPRLGWRSPGSRRPDHRRRTTATATDRTPVPGTRPAGGPGRLPHRRDRPRRDRTRPVRTASGRPTATGSGDRARR